MMTDNDTLLGRTPLLQFFTPEIREQLAGLFEEQQFGFGDVIVQQGAAGDAFYILKSGRARVYRTGEDGTEIPLNVLRPGEEFGEMALFQEGKRTASVRCSTDVIALRLDRSAFLDFLERCPDARGFVQLRMRHRTLHNFLREHSRFGSLPLPVLKEFLSRLAEMEVPKGALIVKEGEEPGPMYVIESGQVRVFASANGRSRNLAFLRAGDYFGELSVLQGARRAATAEAVTGCRLLSLDADSLAELMETYPEFRAVLLEHIATYNYEREARVPLDFSQELLPADALMQRVEIDAEGKAEAAPPREPRQKFATEEGFFRKKRRRVRSVPFVRQIDEMDCGAAAIAMICRHFGRRVSLARIRNLAHTSVDGTSLKAIVGAASELGLAARAVKASPEDLDNVPLPCIAHYEGNHWIVIIDVRRGHVRVADPARGIHWLPRAEFVEKWSGYAALFDYTSGFEQAPEGQSTWGWALEFVRPHRWTLLQILLLAIVTSGIQLLLPVLTQVIVDKVVVERDLQTLEVIIIAMVIALAFMLAANVLQRFMLSFAAIHIDAAILDFLTRKMLALPMSYFNNRRTGDIQRRLDGARQVREFIVHSGISGLLSLVQIGAYLTVMGMYSITLLFVFLLTMPFYVGLMFFSRRVLGPLFERLEESYGRYSSHQIDAIKGIEAVKAASAEQSFRDAMLNEFLSVSRTQFRSNFTILFYDSAVQSVGFLSTVLFLWVGARMVMDGAFTLGGFVAFNALVAMAYTPIMNVLGLWDELQLSSVLMNRLNDIFDNEPEQGHDRTRLIPVRTLEGRVEFRNVGFRYGGPGAPDILKNITIEVEPGKTIAVVGRSGSGKTTLIKILAGLLEPSAGTIFFDGIDMKTLNHRDLRKQVGIVLQDNYMFNDSILNNIAFGDPEPDIDRAVWAARIANAHDFISRFPLGYETRIGETGIAVSGGQRQRIAIARAVYNDPPILIFDEATSALDTESERAIQENLNTILHGRTAFVIAHRLSTIRNADRIVVLEKGQIAEQGSHDELMALRGLYFYLCSQQMGL